MLRPGRQNFTFCVAGNRLDLLQGTRGRLLCGGKTAPFYAMAGGKLNEVLMQKKEKKGGVGGGDKKKKSVQNACVFWDELQL